MFTSTEGPPAGAIRVTPLKDGTVAGHVIYSGSADVRSLLLNGYPQIPARWRTALADAVSAATPHVELGSASVASQRSFFMLFLLGDASYGQQFLSTTLINGMLRDCRTLYKVV